MEKQFKTLEFIYQDMQIHFLVNPHNNNVMVNATEMAKAFDKRTKDYLANQSTKEFILALERTLNSVHSDVKILDNRGHMGIYFDRRLALDFAAWLDVDFRVWVFSTIDNIVFGNYKKHWEAHQKQEQAKLKLSVLKNQLLTAPTAEIAIEYFETEKIVNDTRNEKQKALQNQYKIDLFKE